MHIAATNGHVNCMIVSYSLDSRLTNTETPVGYTAMRIAATNGHVNCMIVSYSLDSMLTSIDSNRIHCHAYCSYQWTC